MFGQESSVLWFHNDTVACSTSRLPNYDSYSESKYHFAVKKSSKVSCKILLLSVSTFFKLFFIIFATIIEALIVAGHKFLYSLLIECGRLRC